MRKYVVIAVVILIGVITALSYSLKQEKVEVKRLTGNQRSLLDDVKLYRTKDSLSAASIERLQLTKKEYEKHFADQAKTIEGLNIQIKRLLSVSETGTETKYPINVPVKDSTVVRDSLITIKCIELHNPYLDMSGCIEADRFIGNIVSRDTLIQAVYRVPHQFWFIKWGTKAIRQEIVCKNPNSRIVYSQYIELKK